MKTIDVWFKIARDIVPECDWVEFVLSTLIFNDVNKRFPNYCKDIIKKWNHDMIEVSLK